MARYKYIKKIVSSILSECGITKAPVDLNVILKCKGVSCVEDELGAVSGAAVVDGDRHIIVLNKEENPKRRRFTIAHELGHLILHSKQSLNVDKEPIFFFRDHVSSEGSNIKEIEANFFAACLLMPESFIHKELDNLKAGLQIDDDEISSLANKFEVSFSAMCIRLGAIGIA